MEKIKGLEVSVVLKDGQSVKGKLVQQLSEGCDCCRTTGQWELVLDSGAVVKAYGRYVPSHPRDVLGIWGFNAPTFEES